MADRDRQLRIEADRAGSAAYSKELEKQKKQPGYSGTTIYRGDSIGIEGGKFKNVPSAERLAKEGEELEDLRKAYTEGANEYRRETTRGIQKMKAGGVAKSSASKRADGCATKGKTKGRMV